MILKVYKLFSCFLLLLFGLNNCSGQNQFQFIYSPGVIIKWFTPKYEDFKDNLIISPNNKFTIQWTRMNTKIGYSFGITHSIENMPFDGKVILQEEKYETIWMRNYKSYFVEIPIGIWIKVNKNIEKHSLIIFEPTISFYAHEEYFYHEGRTSYTPPYTDPIVYESNYTDNYFGISRLLLSIKFDRETKIGKNLVLSRGASISLPSISKISNSSLELSNFKINGFIGIGYNF